MWVPTFHPRRALLGLALAALMATPSTACDRPTPAAAQTLTGPRLSVAVAVARVTVDPTSATLRVGDTLRFQATAYDAAGEVIRNRTFGWSIQQTNVATVEHWTGLARAVSPGSALLKVSTGGKTAMAAITVVAAEPPPPDTAVPPPADTVTPPPPPPPVDTTSPPPADTTVTPPPPPADTTTLPPPPPPPPPATGGSGTDECAAPQAGWVICDGFEGHALGTMAASSTSGTGCALPPEWSVATCAQDVEATAVFTGAHALHIHYQKGGADANKFVQADLRAYGLTHFFSRARFLFHSSGQESDQKKLFYYWSSATSPGPCSAWCTVVKADKASLSQTGTEPLVLVFSHEYYDSGLGKPRWTQFQAGTLTYDTWHDVEWEEQLNSNPACTAGVDCDGAVSVWVDGVLTAQRSGLKLREDPGVLGRTRVGAQANDLNAYSEDRYLDNVVISRTRIGPAQ